MGRSSRRGTRGRLQGWAWSGNKMCSVVWVAGCMSPSRVFPVLAETKITETSGQNDLRPPVGEDRDGTTEAAAAAPAAAEDYIWQRDKTREARRAIKFVENCQPRNMNGEITGKSHFRVCCI